MPSTTITLFQLVTRLPLSCPLPQLPCSRWPHVCHYHALHHNYPVPGGHTSATIMPSTTITLFQLVTRLPLSCPPPQLPCSRWPHVCHYHALHHNYPVPASHTSATIMPSTTITLFQVATRLPLSCPPPQLPCSSWSHVCHYHALHHNYPVPGGHTCATIMPSTTITLFQVATRLPLSCPPPQLPCSSWSHVCHYHALHHNYPVPGGHTSATIMPSTTITLFQVATRLPLSCPPPQLPCSS